MSNTLTIWQSIAIGGFGGATAGIIVFIAKSIVNFFQDERDKKKVYKWLKKNTSKERVFGSIPEYRSTRTIASYNNITEDRVRYICSTHKEIYLSTGKVEDLWGIDRGESYKETKESG